MLGLFQSLSLQYFIKLCSLIFLEFIKTLHVFIILLLGVLRCLFKLLHWLLLQILDKFSEVRVLIFEVSFVLGLNRVDKLFILSLQVWNGLLVRYLNLFKLLPVAYLQLFKVLSVTYLELLQWSCVLLALILSELVECLLCCLEVLDVFQISLFQVVRCLP